MTAQRERPSLPTTATLARHAVDVWAGVECSHLRLGRRTVDQLRLTGHNRRLSDLDLLASLGAKRVRYPVLWERVAPRGR